MIEIIVSIFGGNLILLFVHIGADQVGREAGWRVGRPIPRQKSVFVVVMDGWDGERSHWCR
jgi:hypothetical protein